jgi:hypothetical protein
MDEFYGGLEGVYFFPPLISYEPKNNIYLDSSSIFIFTTPFELIYNREAHIPLTLPTQIPMHMFSELSLSFVFDICIWFSIPKEATRPLSSSSLYKFLSSLGY